MASMKASVPLLAIVPRLFTNTSILDGEGGVSLVNHNLDEKVWLGLNLLWLNDGLVSDFVEGIGSIEINSRKKSTCLAHMHQHPCHPCRRGQHRQCQETACWASNVRRLLAGQRQETAC